MKKNNSILFKKILPHLKNKFILTFLGFFIWLSFFDRNDFITTWSYHNKLESLKSEKAYYESEVIRYTEDLNNLMTNSANLEKYAREKYFMKKDNEDIFVIIDESPKKK